MTTITKLTVRLPAPHPGQQRVLDGASRFNVLACGRRWGKTKLCMRQAIRPAIEQRWRIGYFAPTYKMFGEIWRELTQRLPPPLAKPSVEDQRLELLGGGVIDLWSLEEPDKVRGRAYHRVIVEEAAMVRDLMNVWQAIIRPTLTDYRGDAWFPSTPRGFNDFETLFGYGQDPERPEWAAFHAPTSDNPHISPDEIEAARRDLKPTLFGQEFLADFLSDASAVFTEGLDITPWLQPIPAPELAPHQGTYYRHPHPECTYLMGVDVAEGLEHGDRSCCVVLERDGMGRCVEAAHLCGTYPTDTWAELVDQLACAYGGILGVERNNHGHAVLDHLRRFQADRLTRHERQPYTLFREQAPLKSPTSAGVATHSGEWGWNTTIASKPLMIDELEEGLRTGVVRFATPELQRELRSYQRDEKGRTSAPAGKHDDRVMALGIAWQMRKWANVRAGYRTLKAVNMNLTAGRR